MIMNRNPNYREELYPTEHMPSDEAAGRTAAAGKKLPLVDRIETIFYSETLPMWLEFRSRKLGFTTVPAAYYDEAFNKRKKYSETCLCKRRHYLPAGAVVGFHFLRIQHGRSRGRRLHGRKTIPASGFIVGDRLGRKKS